jgi:hypothetical protein
MTADAAKRVSEHLCTLYSSWRFVIILTAFTMKPADFDQLSDSEKQHFYRCEQCGEMVDMRQLDDVLFHEDHVHRPDIQYGGSQRLGESSSE